MLGTAAFLTAVSLLTGPSAAIEGADDTSPATRARVRIQNEQGKWVIGRLFSVSQATITLADEFRGPMELARGSRFEVSRGARRHPLRGFVIGALPGAAFGVWWCSGFTEPGETCSAISGALLGLYTGALGAGIGFLIKTERWEPISPDRVQISVGPAARGGLAASLTIKF